MHAVANICCDTRGHLIEIFFFYWRMSLNRKEPICCSLANKLHSSVGLGIADAYTSSRMECGSSHFPIGLCTLKSNECPLQVTQLKNDSADREQSQNISLILCADMCVLSKDDAVQYLTAFPIDAALKCIPETS